jgi:hypothetical protein
MTGKNYEDMKDLPTHRIRDGHKWQRWNEVLGKWEDTNGHPAQKMKKMEEVDGWKYFQDTSLPVIRVYTLKNQKITPAERRVLAKFGADIQLHLELVSKVKSDLPLVDQLRIAGENVRAILESGFWLQEE